MLKYYMTLWRGFNYDMYWLKALVNNNYISKGLAGKLILIYKMEVE